MHKAKKNHLIFQHYCFLSLAAFVENPGWSPSTHIASHTICNSGARGYDVFWSPWALYTCGAQTHIQVEHSYT